MGDAGDGQRRGETDPARAITVPPFPSGEVATEAAADDQSSSSAAQTLAARDRHKAERQSRELRERFSWIVTALVILWMVAIYALLLFQGTKSMFGLAFQLSDKVMLGALGTVTLNVIGLLVIVLRFVFPAVLRGKK